jgi:hypothetical protein
MVDMPIIYQTGFNHMMSVVSVGAAASVYICPEQLVIVTDRHYMQRLH